MLSLLVSILLPNALYANLFGGDEPIAPELAFIPEIESVDTDSLFVQFEIVDGYYLYRDKNKFTANDTNVNTGAPEFAEAIVINDDFFGEQAIFRDSTRIEIPYTAKPGVSRFELSVTFQGCADIGLCYPPTTVALGVKLPENLSSTESGGLAGMLSNPIDQALSNSTSSAIEKPLSALLNADSGSPELLPPELAFLPQITGATNQGIDVSWFIEDGYYLYRDKLHFTLEPGGAVPMARMLVSEGEQQHDEFFGDVMVLRHNAKASITLSADAKQSIAQEGLSDALLTIHYQGCADIGVCFPPSTTTLPVTFLGSFAGSGDIDNSAAMVQLGGDSYSNMMTVAANATISDVDARSSTESLVQSEQDRLTSLLGSSSMWLTVLTFFGLGLLLAFTPCVLPMIPILSSLIVGQGQSMSTTRAFQLSLVYVLVMASTYAIVGIAVGLSGYNVQAFLQNPIVLSLIAALFVILSFSMFGFYELQMPTAIQNRLTQWSNKQGGGQIGGVAAMGFISTLIVGPCVTAPLAGALIYIAKTGDAFIGGAALFALGLGMGAPLLLIGTSAGKFVPKAGAWMDTTKHIFGILMLGMAVYMISRFVEPTITIALYGVLAVMSAVYLGATDSLTRQSTGWQRFGKGVGLVVGLYGLALLVGALAGSPSYTKPLGALTQSSDSSHAAHLANAGLSGDHSGEHSGDKLNFQPVKGVDNLQSVVASASAQNRPVMLKFFADWCISCKEMEAFTFSDPRVQQLLSSAVLIEADVTANDSDDQALLKAFDLFGPPGIIFYDASGQELRAARVVGFMNAEDFAAHIERFIGTSAT